jgi:hypothetical protein
MTQTNRFLKLPKFLQLLLCLSIVLAFFTAAEFLSWRYYKSHPSVGEFFFTKGIRDDPSYGADVYINYPYVSYCYRPNARNVRRNLDTDSFGFIHNGDPTRDLSQKPKGAYRIFLRRQNSVGFCKSLISSNFVLSSES